MLVAALRDLQWRRRRFLIAVIGTAVVFAMTLVLTGLANGFRVEAHRTVDSFGIDHYVIRDGASGPFIGSSPFPAAVVARTDFGGETALLVFAGATFNEDSHTVNANIFGAPEEGPGMPAVLEGRPPAAPDEAAVSSTMGHELGKELEIASHRIRIVGLVGESTALAGQPNIFLTTAGARLLVYGEQPLVSSVGVRGELTDVPEGFRALDRHGAVDDLLRPLAKAITAITLMAVLLWIVAALIVGSVIYLSALERTREFAVFKAIGVATRSVYAGLALQAVIVAMVAAAVGVLLSGLLAPLFPMPVVVPGAAYLLVPVMAVTIGLLASLAGLRRAVTVDPALAFGGP